jgi:hypothetical protein
MEPARSQLTVEESSTQSLFMFMQAVAAQPFRVREASLGKVAWSSASD